MNHPSSSEWPDVRRSTRGVLLSLSLTFVILVSLVAGAALAAPSLSPDGVQIENPPVQQSGSVQAAIDPRVLKDTANGQNGHFLVLLKQQPDSRKLASAASDRASQGTLVVDALRSVAAASQAPVAAQLDALGASYRAYWVANVLAVEGNRAVVEAMAARPDVQAIESDRAFTVTLEPSEAVSPAAVTAVGWNLTWINAPAVWALGDTGQNTVYANADTGVQWTHPALQPHYRGWNGTSADHNYSWWDAIHADIDGNGNSCGFNLSAPCDDNGHGTHTMGTGVGDDGAGNQIGVAPGAKWIACRNMDAGVGRPSTYIECMQFFLAPTDLSGSNPDPSKRPDAVGNSYGCPSSELCTATSLLTAMDNLRAAGIFMAVSAGNSGSGCSTVTDPPALYDSAITVGATGYNTNSIASYSSRGPVTADGSGRAKPDLVAPGSSVRSSYPTNTYTTMSGTSMASPHVAGAVALLWSAFPTLRGNVDHTEFILEQTALHLTTTQGCGGDGATQVPNNVYGHGRIDVLAAYDYAAAEVPVTPAAPTGLAAAAVSSSQIDLTWADNANNETGFKIERSPDGVTWAQIATAAANATTYSDLGLAASTSYSYRVRAYNTAGDSAYSNTATAVTAAAPAVPTAPSNLTAKRRIEQPDQPDLDRQRHHETGLQDRALHRRGLHQLRPDRHGGCERDQLLEHRAGRIHQLQLPRAGLQHGRRFGLFQHRHRGDASSPGASRRAVQPDRHGRIEEPDQPVLDG